ncbi:phosphotransferase family protein [Amycolatopsis sp. FDAARGOS 1241]|uniref:phosphotransferase family protein n=1 Tax=Amycolatopsis sp. FDAARGOS 1241 TaxID=2778070 RepID=UPI00194F9B7B|nr:phosphotransferase family protein [Amycolatopsis sp. FDAARGOS 1241]QRP43696.1 phosphotransferase family protein [Amycolatopsis sp. FDAARGOS 1241]
MTPSDPPGLDLARLRAYLDEQRPGLVAGELTGEVVQGGRSNLTYIVDDGASRWVVRRPPLGHVLPTAHDMAREFTVISGLAGTAVPVPGTVLLCQDPDVLGAQFYVMEFVEGTPYRTDAELAKLGTERTREIGYRLVDTLVDLHAVNPGDVGLGDFGRPDGFLERQLRRWKKQLDGSRSRDLPGADELHDSLAAKLPTSPPATIVHGDYRLDNVLVDADDRITAVLDWEMSTLGDPLTDLALLVAYAERDKVSLQMVSNASSAPGYPSPDEVIARYAELSGRDVSALNWYVSFAFFKLAVILEGIYFRYRKGQTVGAGFESIGDAVAPLVSHGYETLKEEK